MLLKRIFSNHLAFLDLDFMPNAKVKEDVAQNAWENGLNIGFAVIGVVALLMIVINGFLYITAAGDPQKTAHARSGLLYAAIGLIVALVSATIVTYVVGGIT